MLKELLTSCGAVAAGTALAANFPFTGISPVILNLENDDQIIANLKQVKNEYQLHRFFLCTPGIGVRLGAMKTPDFYRAQGQRVNYIKNALQPYGIEINWWCSPSFKVGLSDRATPMTNVDGKVSDVSHCPLDDAWTQQVIANMTAFVAACHPPLMILEDDFELSNHPNVHFGCFCPRHLQKFAEKVGKKYTREELLAEFTRGNIALRRAWGELSCATLVEFAQKLRAAIDQVSPETRIGLCQAGCSRFDGDFVVPVARALAGTKHRPLVRATGSTYSSDDSGNLIDALSFFKHYMQVLPPDFEIVHETDSYPHNAFFVSARKLDALLTAALTYGADGSLFYALQYLDDPLEEKNYLKLWQKNLPKYQTIARLIDRAAPPLGWIKTTYQSDNCHAVPYNGRRRPMSFPNCWLNVLGRYGLHVDYLTAADTARDNVIFADVQDLKMLSRPEIMALLKRNVVLDGAAALYLCEQGLARYLGLTAYRDTARATFLYERIRDEVKPPRLRGQLMYNFVIAPAGQEGGGFVRIRNLHPQAEILTEFVAENNQVAQVGMAKFRNELGGQILTLAYDLHANQSSSIFNYRKQELLAQEIEKMSGQKIPFRVHHANVFTILRRSREPGKFYVTLIPLGSDSIRELDCSWAVRPRRVRELAASGQWQELKVQAEPDHGKIACPLERLQPVFLEVTL